MSGKAVSKNVRVSPRKLRMYVDCIRGTSLGRAFSWLQVHAMKKTIPLAKTLLSAFHNAKQADAAITDMDQLIVKEVMVGKGATIRYFKPSAQGRASAQRKRLSHISVIVEKCQSTQR